MFGMGNGRRARGRPRRRWMDEAMETTSTAEGSSLRHGGMERCGH